ncbi:MAG: response regulator [Burkholderiaceae bacterium]
MPLIPLFVENFIEVSFDPKTQALYANWKGYQSVASIRVGCEAMLKFLDEKKLRKVLNDNTNVLGIWRSAAEWMAMDWFPRMKDAGMDAFAWVYSSSRLSQISTDDTLAMLDPGKYGIKLFHDKAEAQTWLDSASAAPARQPGKPRVLVIEDNRDFSILFSDMLKIMGCETEVSYTAEAGLDYARRAKPDMIFCDLSLPGNMDGFAFAAAVCQMPELQHIPLIAVSGRTAAEDQERALAAGFHRVFPKPVKFGHVSKALEEFSQGRFFQA